VPNITDLWSYQRAKRQTGTRNGDEPKHDGVWSAKGIERVQPRTAFNWIPYSFKDLSEMSQDEMKSYLNSQTGLELRNAKEEIPLKSRKQGSCSTTEIERSTMPATISQKFKIRQCGENAVKWAGLKDAGNFWPCCGPTRQNGPSAHSTGHHGPHVLYSTRYAGPHSGPSAGPENVVVTVLYRKDKTLR